MTNLKKQISEKAKQVAMMELELKNIKDKNRDLHSMILQSLVEEEMLQTRLKDIDLRINELNEKFVQLEVTSDQLLQASADSIVAFSNKHSLKNQLSLIKKILNAERRYQELKRMKGHIV